MLTLPVGAGRAANRPARILVIGRSETVLSEAVMILRDKGYAAGATNEFDRTLDLFDAAQLDLVVFGGMVPPDTREHLREQISTRNPAVAFVQGYAGIPGLIAAQVEAALSGGATGPAASVRYDPRSRSIGISLDGPQDVTVIAWWATSFVPPEPKSTSRVILDEEFPAGAHTIAIPDRVRTRVDVLDESRACGGPAEKLPRRGAGRREVHAEEGADPPEMTLDVIRGDRYDGKGEGAADGLRDVAGGYAVFRDGVQARAGRGLRQPKRDEARGIGPVHGGPPVGPVARVAGDALFAGHRGDDRDEPVVASTVHGRRKAQAHGVHTAADELEREILAAPARRLRAMERGRVVLAGGPAPGEAGDARGEQEGAAGAGQRIAYGLDRGSLGRGRCGWVGPVVLVREVDDGLGGLGARTDAGQIVEVAAVDVSPLGPEGGGGSAGPGQTGDLMPGGEKLIDGGGTDPSGGSGDENAHGICLLRLRGGRSG